MFEPKVFRKQMYCIEDSTCKIVGTFVHPYSDLGPKAFGPKHRGSCSPSLGPCRLGFHNNPLNPIGGLCSVARMSRLLQEREVHCPAVEEEATAIIETVEKATHFNISR